MRGRGEGRVSTVSSSYQAVSPITQYGRLSSGYVYVCIYVCMYRVWMDGRERDVMEVLVAG